MSSRGKLASDVSTLTDNFLVIKNNYAKLTDIPKAELPVISSGDAGKVLGVKSDETGVEWTIPSRLLLKDANNVVYEITVDTSGNLVATAQGV